MFKVNNKNTTFWCIYYNFEGYFTPFSSAFIVDFEPVNNWFCIKIEQ